MKKSLKYFLIFLLSFSFALAVKADSGWDSDYDSSDYGSYSSSDYDSYDYDSYDYDDYHYSSGSSNSSSGNVFFTIFFTTCLLIAIGIYLIYKSNSYKNLYGSNNTNDKVIDEPTYIDITEEELQKFLPQYTLFELKKEIFNKFVASQKAWMNFDYNKLKELCTDELYNSYKAQLDTLKLKNGKNIMHDFAPKNTTIYKIVSENNTLIVYVNFIISFKDYVIDTTNDEVIRGSKDKTIINNYLMEFVITRDSTVDKCPNCGADIKNIVNSTCPYCRTIISKDKHDLILSRKSNINK